MRTNLKVFRVANKLTQGEFGDRIGYGRATIMAIEKGRREGRKSFWNALKTEFNLDEDTLNRLKQND